MNEHADKIVTIDKLKKGDLFTRKEGANTTYERGPYCRTNKAYECTDIEDINKWMYFKKGKEVFPI